VTGPTAPDGTLSGPTSPASPHFGVQPAAVRRALVWGLALLLVGYAAIRLIPMDAVASAVGFQMLFTLVVGIALVSMWVVFGQTTGIERRYWGFSSAGLLCLLIGHGHDVIATGVALSGGPPSASWAGFFDLAGIGCLVALLLTFSRFRHASRAARARYITDVVAVSIVVTGALEMWVIGPWFDAVSVASAWSRILYAASPVVGGLSAVGMVVAVFGTRFDRWEKWERLLAASVTLASMGLMLAPIAYVELLDGGAGGFAVVAHQLSWTVGVYLGLAGAVARHTAGAGAWQLRPFAPLDLSFGWVAAVGLPSLEVVALPVLGFAAAEADDPSIRLVRLVVVGAIALALAARTLLTVIDNDALAAGATSDPLTRLHNHRYYQSRLDAEIAAAVRYGEGVSLILLDVDDFCSINASGGHAAGDVILVEMARAVERAVRTCDVVCRSGGDEIAIILPQTPSDTALGIAERVLREMRTVSGSNGRRVTASAGVACLPLSAGERSELVDRAEAALYWAKTHGKDRAFLFDGELTVAGDIDERVRALRERADHATVRSLAAAVDARDEKTQDHSGNVARYAVAMARALDLDDRTVLQIEHAALLHDVGKIGVPDAVLFKAGPLSASEWASMRQHAVLGEEILSSTTMREILPWVRHHHEHWDGTGYPDGLSGEEIPLGARIIALANAYDAMRSSRPHRAALSRTAALQEIDLGLGRTYDPVLGEMFIDVVGGNYL